MASKKRWTAFVVVVLALSLVVMNGCGEKKSQENVAGDKAAKKSEATAQQATQDEGFPIYPGAVEDPENPPVNAPHMKNIHVVTSDPFDKVVEWYSQKLGPFDVERQEKGSQAMWSKDMGGGVVMTTTISNILAPPGKVAIVLTRGSFGK